MRRLGFIFIGVLLAIGGSLGSPPSTAYAISAKDIKAFVKEQVDQKVKEGGGVFKIKDVNTGQEVALEFVNVRIVRRVPGHGYFADVVFRVQGEPEKFYDVDFWVKRQGDQLVLMDERIHKYPKKLEGNWVMATVEPLPWWWMLAQEHPGEVEEFKAWEIKAAIHTHINEKVKEGGGVIKIKDDKTGEELKLEFVRIHNPVRKVKGEGYFACSDFRVQGEPEKLYDLDFWLKQEGDKLVITKTRIHKEPAKEGTTWVKKPRYSFDESKMVEIP
ncbi:MAG: hypothetical protein ACE5MG_03845 [Candidatus Methylomirabilales bacterium]